MGRDSGTPSQTLIEHPVTEIDRFLDDMDLEPAWVGIGGGPQYEGDGEIVVSYNVRIIDGPYSGLVSAEFDYRYDEDASVKAEELYPRQVEAIKTAFPDSEIRCYVPEAWQRD